MPDLTVSLSIKNPTDGSELVSFTDRPMTGRDDTKAAQDFYKEVYKEALNHYRFFGNLRAQIAWPPATIISAAIALFAKQENPPPAPEVAFTRILVAFSIVIALIFIVNCYFQVRQKRSLMVGKYAHLKLIDSYEKAPPSALESYSAILERVRRWRDVFIPDIPTLTLGLFLLCVFYITGIFLSVLWKVSSGWLWGLIWLRGDLLSGA